RKRSSRAHTRPHDLLRSAVLSARPRRWNSAPDMLIRSDLLRLGGERDGEEHRTCTSKERAAVDHLGSPTQLNYPVLRRGNSSAKSHGTCWRTSRHASGAHGKVRTYRRATETLSQDK